MVRNGDWPGIVLSPRPVIPLRISCGAAIRRRSRTMHTHDAAAAAGRPYLGRGCLGWSSLVKRVVCTTYPIVGRPEICRMAGNMSDGRISIMYSRPFRWYRGAAPRGYTRPGVGAPKTTRCRPSRFVDGALFRSTADDVGARRQHSCWSSAFTANTGTVSGHRLPNVIPHLPYGSHRQQFIRRVGS